jgi:hypothetical protein
VDNCWGETRSCERHSKDDWDDDLGCKRSSGVFAMQRGLKRESGTAVTV